MPSDERYKDPDWLREQLVVEDRTQADVAEECGVSNQAVWYWKDKFEGDEWAAERKNGDSVGVLGEPGVIEPAGVRSVHGDVLELEVGEKIDVEQTLDREWHEPLTVAEIDEVEWLAPGDRSWATRQVTIWRGGASPNNDLVYRITSGTGPAVLERLEDEDWVQCAEVTDVDVVGEVQRSTLFQLQARDDHEVVQETSAGDDSWRDYYLAGDADA